MFKLTYQAFIMMGLLLGAAAGRASVVWEKKKILGGLAGSMVILVFVSQMIFPTEAFNSYYGNFKEYKGLDGEAWMRKDMPEKYGAIVFLRLFGDGGRMVEAVGDSYTDFNAVSAFSGVPTVMGWRVHEWLWRGSYEPVGKRDEEVKSIYEGDDPETTKKLLDKYQVDWILVGADEKEKYRVNENKLHSLGEVMWKQNEVYLIKVARQ
jgi:uncharacterized membrane protein